MGFAPHSPSVRGGSAQLLWHNAVKSLPSKVPDPPSWRPIPAPCVIRGVIEDITLASPEELPPEIVLPSQV